MKPALGGRRFKYNIALFFMGINRNKRALALDLRHDDGQARLMRLLDDADVLLEIFKTGITEK